jgi:hypothetical protein
MSQRIDGFFAKRTCFAESGESGKFDTVSSIVVSEVPVRVPEHPAESEVHSSIDAPTRDSSSHVSLVIGAVLDGKSLSDTQKLEIIQERKPPAGIRCHSHL